MPEDFFEVIHRAPARRFGTDERAAVAAALAGQDAVFKTVADALVLAEQIADLAAADADIARRNVDVRADVPIQLGHERLAEPHDLRVALAVRIKVRTAFGAAHRQRRQTVFERLFKGEELHNGKIHV